MVAIAFTAPPLAPPPAPVNPWRAMSMTWTDYLGRVWDLTGRGSGIAMKPGIRGFNMPPVQPWTRESPGIHGSTQTGWRAEEREVFWPCMVYKDTSDVDWVLHDRTFWDTMHPDREGVWTVIDPLGQERHLRLRYRGDGGHSTDMMPTLRGWENYGIYLAAQQPFWEGKPVTDAFGEGNEVNFYGGPEGGGYGPPFYLASAHSANTATITNPGDLPAWPVWHVYGPVDNVVLGVAGRTLTYTTDIAAGKVLKIDTDPLTGQRGWLGDVDPETEGIVDPVPVVMPAAAQYAAVPSGRDQPITINITGSGRVRIDLTPLYLRAW